MTEEREQALITLKTARGQINGIIKMIEDGRYCMDISNQILAAASLLRKVNVHVLSGHLHSCVKDAVKQGDVEEKLKEIEDTLKIILR